MSSYSGVRMPRDDLFPEITPFASGYLPLSAGHLMYWEQVGNPSGPAVLFLHGGPGAGAGPVHRRFFDPGFWRVVLFDQRGSGRSQPLGSLAANTTAHLLADIEALRVHLGIDRWLLFGGSWGSTLALAYAEAFPERVSGCVLRGVFLGRPQEVAWFLYGLATVFPDAHAAFAGHLPAAERRDLLAGYLRRLTHADIGVALAAAEAWTRYEGTCSTLLPCPEEVTRFAQDHTALAMARIEAHYFAHDLFLPRGGLLGGVAALAGLPAEIVQGRYDMICPVRTAFELAAAWPGAHLTLVPDAGHSALEPGIRRALVAAVERFRARV